MAHLIEATRKELYNHHFFYGNKREYDYLLKHYISSGGTEEDYEIALSQSSTIYVENLSFYTKEEQIYELFEKCGEVKRVIMGLNRIKKTPCGFCFVEFYHRSDAEDCVKYCRGCKLNNRALKIAIDTGFTEGRQYGRGKDGGMKRDDFTKVMKRRGGGRGGGRGRDSWPPRNRSERGSKDYVEERYNERGASQQQHGGISSFVESQRGHDRHDRRGSDSFDSRPRSPQSPPSSYRDGGDSYGSRYGSSRSPIPYGNQRSSRSQRGNTDRDAGRPQPPQHRYQPYSYPPAPQQYYGRVPERGPPQYGYNPPVPSQQYGQNPPPQQQQQMEIPPPRSYGRGDPYYGGRPYGNFDRQQPAYGRTDKAAGDAGKSSREHYDYPPPPRESRDYGRNLH